MSYASSRPVATTYETWPIAVLVRLVRHDIDDAKVAALVASLRDGKKLPAIFVLIDGTDGSILDGHHRVAAWLIAGVESAPVIVLRPK